MSPVFGIGLKLILGEMRNRHFLSEGTPGEVMKDRKSSMISRLAAIEYRSPRDQFDRLLTFTKYLKLDYKSSLKCFV